MRGENRQSCAKGLGATPIELSGIMICFLEVLRPPVDALREKRFDTANRKQANGPLRRKRISGGGKGEVLAGSQHSLMPTSQILRPNKRCRRIETTRKFNVLPARRKPIKRMGDNGVGAGVII